MFAKPNGADRSEISHEEVVETQLSNLTVIPLCGNLKGTKTQAIQNLPSIPFTVTLPTNRLGAMKSFEQN